MLFAIVLAAACADLLYPDDPMAMVAQPLLWPGQDAAFPLGTDSLGRDIAAGIVHGARASLVIGFVSSAVAMLIGTAVGAVAGFYRKTDGVLMRASELFQTIPQFMLVIVLLVVVGPSLRTIIAAVAAPLAEWAHEVNPC